MDSGRKDTARKVFTPGRLAVLGVVAVAFVVAVLVWFQPQKLLQDERVNEPAPVMAEEDEAMEADDNMKDAMTKGEAMTLGGSFRSIDHTTSGTATVALSADDRYFVRLEDFSTENGPDLFVYLSAAPASADEGDFAEDFIDLGSLKGNIGNQNYVVPEGTNLKEYKSVVIWCRRFNSAFGAAPLLAQ